MKKTYAFLVAGLFAAAAPITIVAQIASTSAGASTVISLVSSDPRETVLRFQPGRIQLHTVTTPNGESVTVSTDQATPILRAGAPDLAKLTASVIIPDAGNTVLEIVSSQYHDIANVTVAPSKGNLYRTQDPAAVPYTYGEEYSKNEFFPAAEADVREPYIARDYRGQVVMAYAFRYNPVTKTLRVYDEIVVKLRSVDGTGINELHRINRPVPTDFEAAYSRQFLNYTEVTSQRYSAIGEQGEMLVIAHGPFMAAMQPFVTWKNQRGIPTTMIDVAVTGNTAAGIKSYIANYYSTHNLAFVLLVGDAPQVTPSQTQYGPSDNEYGYLAGNDHYPEVIIGRFSAELVTHVNTMVTRTLEYERTPAAGNWYTECLGIGSDQGPGDDNEMDFEHERNLGTSLLAYNYLLFDEVYDGSQGGSDAPGDPGPIDVAGPVNNGVGIINYTGHGSSVSFGTTGFSTTDVAALTNTHKWPFIFSVACVNGEFMNGTCFAESWLRAESASTHEPTGAIATMMSTINQSWNPPMEGQDEMNAILIETYSSTIRRTFGSIVMNGCMQMNDAYGASGDEMTDTWTVFGDPSLMIRTLSPQVMNVTHAPTAVLGALQFTVNCSVNDAFVTLWQNGQILGSGTVNGGNVTINFANALSSLDSIWVTAVEYNYTPYHGYVLVTPASGPYVLHASNLLQDPAGNNNNLADYNETVGMDVTLQNVGLATANSVNAVLSTADASVTITDNTEGYGTINAGGSQQQANAYTFDVMNNVPDQHVVPFTLTVTDNNSNTWTSQLSVTLNAPVLGTGVFVMDDAAANNNGTLDPGETVNILIPTNNNGHSNSPAATGTLTSSSPYITINNGSFPLGVINVSGVTNAVFSITVTGSAPIGATVDLTYDVTAGAYTANRQYQQRIGIAQETYETNTLTQYNWQTSGAQPWFTTTNNVLNGQYCTESGNINDNEQSVLSISLNVLSNDSVYFWYSVSSEAGYDYLRFYVDNTMQQDWTGTIGWTHAAFAVPSGNRTLKWVYEKDYIYSAGQDCAWIDDVVFPAFTTGVAVAEQTVADGTGLYPNPANGPVTFFWNTASASSVQITLLDASGRVVNAPYSVNDQPAGQHAFTWSPEGMAAGVYFATITINGQPSVIKVVLK